MKIIWHWHQEAQQHQQQQQQQQLLATGNRNNAVQGLSGCVFACGITKQQPQQQPQQQQPQHQQSMSSGTCYAELRRRLCQPHC
ncbi:hypothetical protein AWZ03_007721 [Drosophila navojoa]|uniref:Uncharacterized protein n=1 Tax=Drosophila navojoa TaxID=7232 RepID=A0A484BAI6_DRONA|nr:hypothetical protein AWZ03_007721 [Drosophila navojoa]